jgi:hypothetical protein
LVKAVGLDETKIATAPAGSVTQQASGNQVSVGLRQVLIELVVKFDEPGVSARFQVSGNCEEHQCTFFSGGSRMRVRRSLSSQAVLA